MRQAGCLIPLFSIRSPQGWGLGEIPDLVPFARWAAQAGFSVVQVLPTHEASRGQSSPYAALSAFAIDPVYVSVDALEDFAAAGGREALRPEEREVLASLGSAAAVPWQKTRALKARALDLAFEAFLEREWRQASARARQLDGYAQEHAAWLDDYALFVALHDDRFGGRPWMEWVRPLRDRDPAALASARAELSERILFHRWMQWQLDLQWHAARRDAQAAGVELMGDLPFMVATDSADVWAHPDDFRLDARVGVPPDAFSATGQDWGLPVFRWDKMKAEGYPWWTARAHRSAQLYGLYRVDHVVGLYRTYYRPDDGGPPAFIPAAQADQVANGEELMAIFSRGARVIAEDLGVVPAFVRESMTRCQVPGYRILRWERDWDEPGQPFRDPALWPALSVGTTGTHDTSTLAGWWDEMKADERKAFLALPALAALRRRAPERFDPGVRDAVLELVYGSGSDLLLLPFQDALGARERVNVPGTVGDTNWCYRMPMEVAALAGDLAVAERLRALAARSKRLTR
jgi:4-alpha-glucanotransferase